MIVPVPERPQIEKYEVCEEIGHGGMATVYRAHDKRLDRDVAVKVIHRHLRESKEIAARFVSEARAVAKLKHPNIVEVYDVSEEDAAERYLVVELVRGPTLRKLLAETGHMPAEVAAAIGIEIGGALDHAHEAGVVHRDVKPENVLVEIRDSPLSNRTSQERTSENNGPRIKITDFGIAKLLDAQGVTSTGQVLGSPAHMAPEQIEGGDVTARADVFGLGVLLYECMVGRLPFDGKNPAQVLRRVLDGTFTPPDRARPTVGAQLSRIIEKALAREPEGRYESARALVDALRAELERVGMTDARRELAEYLADPKAYFGDYDARIVKRLVELGKRARIERQLPAAAAFFNRALAFRPDDTELIKQVAGLAQTERMKRFALRAGAILAGSAALGAVAFGVSRVVQQPKLVPSSEQPAVERPTTARSVPIVTNRAAPPKMPVSAAPIDSAPKKSSVRTPYIPVNPPAGEPKLRAVRVTVLGAKGGTVKLDGKPINWLTDKPELPIGSQHQFEGVPPDDKCCERTRPTTVNIVAGEGPQPVEVNIPFRKASITLAGPPGAEVSCPMFFNGSLKSGATSSFPLPGEKKASCTILGPNPGDPPRTFEVNLSPGGSETLSY
jgi:eukaryotic-like serine/threonine-protein kinase